MTPREQEIEKVAQELDDLRAAVLSRFTAKQLIEIAMARKDPDAAQSLYIMTSYHEPQFVAAWHETSLKVQSAVDDLWDVMQWLRDDRLFAQADRIRTLMARLANAALYCPRFSSWDSDDLIRNLARDFPEQLTVKEGKTLAAENARLKAELAALSSTAVAASPTPDATPRCARRQH